MDLDSFTAAVLVRDLVRQDIRSHCGEPHLLEL